MEAAPGFEPAVLPAIPDTYTDERPAIPVRTTWGREEQYGSVVVSSPTVGKSADGKALHLDVDRLIISRALIQANNGAGKSWAIRRSAVASQDPGCQDTSLK